MDPVFNSYIKVTEKTKFDVYGRVIWIAYFYHKDLPPFKGLETQEIFETSFYNYLTSYN